jgi:hypothetical protein
MNHVEVFDWAALSRLGRSRPTHWLHRYLQKLLIRPEPVGAMVYAIDWDREAPIILVIFPMAAGPLQHFTL